MLLVKRLKEKKVEKWVPVAFVISGGTAYLCSLFF